MNEPSRRPANVVAPAPYGDVPTDGAALRMLAHHAARGWSFWLSVSDPATPLVDLRVAEAGLAYEWQLSRAWWAMYSGMDDDDAASEIAEDSAHPEQFGEDLHGFCVFAGMDPDMILPAFPPAEVTS